MSRGVKKDCSLEKAYSLLKYIYVKDALSIVPEDVSMITHVVLNPPFTICESPKINYWKTGKINSAGLFVDKLLRTLPERCALSFILPDVLRSGSRYDSFRAFLDFNILGEYKIWGRFNNKTDVDVFIIHGFVNQNNKGTGLWQSDLDQYIPLSQEFDVRIGPLVAYRDPEVGIEYPYFHAKNSVAWQMIIEASEFRKFNGTVIKPPFVIVKRTSSPNDKYRAQGTVINLKEHVAVENHMIVITPKSGSVDDCLKLLEILKSHQTNEFLNQRIRLRHLTVSAIKEIPIK